MSDARRSLSGILIVLLIAQSLGVGCGGPVQGEEVKPTLDAVVLERAVPSENDLRKVLEVVDDAVAERGRKANPSHWTAAAMDNLREYAQEIQHVAEATRKGAFTNEEFEEKLRPIEQEIIHDDLLPSHHVEPALEAITEARYAWKPEDRHRKLLSAAEALEQSIDSSRLAADLEAHETTEMRRRGLSTEQLESRLTDDTGFDPEIGIEKLREMAKKIGAERAAADVRNRAGELRQAGQRLMEEAERSLVGALEERLEPETARAVSRRLIDNVEQVERTIRAHPQRGRREIENVVRVVLGERASNFDTEAMNEVIDLVESELPSVAGVTAAAKGARRVVETAGTALGKIRSLDDQLKAGDITKAQYDAQLKQEVDQVNEATRKIVQQIDAELRQIEANIERLDRDIAAHERNLRALRRIRRQIDAELKSVRRRLQRCRERAADPAACDPIESELSRLENRRQTVDEEIQAETTKRKSLEKRRSSEHSRKKALKVAKIALGAVLVAAAIFFAFKNPLAALGMLMFALSLFGSGSGGGGDGHGRGEDGAGAGEYSGAGSADSGTDADGGDGPSDGSGHGSGTDPQASGGNGGDRSSHEAGNVNRGSSEGRAGGHPSDVTPPVGGTAGNAADRTAGLGGSRAGAGSGQTTSRPGDGLPSLNRHGNGRSGGGPHGGVQGAETLDAGQGDGGSNAGTPGGDSAGTQGGTGDRRQGGANQGRGSSSDRGVTAGRAGNGQASTPAGDPVAAGQEGHRRGSPRGEGDGRGKEPLSGGGATGRDGRNGAGSPHRGNSGDRRGLGDTVAPSIGDPQEGNAGSNDGEPGPRMLTAEGQLVVAQDALTGVWVVSDTNTKQELFVYRWSPASVDREVARHGTLGPRWTSSGKHPTDLGICGFVPHRHNPRMAGISLDENTVFYLDVFPFATYSKDLSATPNSRLAVTLDRCEQDWKTCCELFKDAGRGPAGIEINAEGDVKDPDRDTGTVAYPVRAGERYIMYRSGDFTFVEEKDSDQRWVYRRDDLSRVVGPNGETGSRTDPPVGIICGFDPLRAQPTLSGITASGYVFTVRMTIDAQSDYATLEPTPKVVQVGDGPCRYENHAQLDACCDRVAVAGSVDMFPVTQTERRPLSDLAENPDPPDDWADLDPRPKKSVQERPVEKSAQLQDPSDEAASADEQAFPPSENRLEPPQERETKEAGIWEQQIDGKIYRLVRQFDSKDVYFSLYKKGRSKAIAEARAGTSFRRVMDPGLAPTPFSNLNGFEVCTLASKSGDPVGIWMIDAERNAVMYPLVPAGNRGTTSYGRVYGPATCDTLPEES